MTCWVGGSVEAVDAREEPLSRPAAEISRMLRNDRDAGLDDVGELDVVEADKGDRLVQFEVVQRLRGADGDDVLGR